MFSMRLSFLFNVGNFVLSFCSMRCTNYLPCDPNPLISFTSTSVMSMSRPCRLFLVDLAFSISPSTSTSMSSTWLENLECVYLEPEAYESAFLSFFSFNTGFTTGPAAAASPWCFKVTSLFNICFWAACVSFGFLLEGSWDFWVFALSLIWSTCFISACVASVCNSCFNDYYSYSLGTAILGWTTSTSFIAADCWSIASLSGDDEPRVCIEYSRASALSWVAA